ncbi:hypothetical protein K2173_020659 [Erythroxylum novogranatense]|uniref:GH18 domain-containing protein n=1 Tax=Erythroxylum novogranatense TaxID=1862640 RepID=A0AAV8TNR8_9ROSI|nr:hypothetical protein K2173_020659 [Erythroxylum novogranatense]
MSTLKDLIFVIPIIVVLTISITGALAWPEPIKAAYYPSWSEDFPPSAIDTTLFTHIFYAFLSPNNATYRFDISDSTAKLLSNFTATLHWKTPGVKTLLAFGGANNDRKLYARMVAGAVTRGMFINSAIEVAREYGFDGVDLDWEYPESSEDMENLGKLFQEWRQAILEEAKLTRRSPLLLTAAVYFSPEFLWGGNGNGNYRKYPVESIAENLDWINAMCYDYHGSWEPNVTGSHALLYDHSSNISTSYGLKSWIGAGLPRTKLVMGLPQYGKTWQLKDPNVNGIGAPAVAAGPVEGVLTYRQLVSSNADNGATEVYDQETVSTYSYGGSLWIGYDDARSTAEKLRYGKELRIGGYFFWALSFDDSEWKLSRLASGTWSEYY